MFADKWQVAAGGTQNHKVWSKINNSFVYDAISLHLQCAERSEPYEFEHQIFLPTFLLSCSGQEFTPCSMFGSSPPSTVLRCNSEVCLDTCKLDISRSLNVSVCEHCPESTRSEEAHLQCQSQETPQGMQKERALFFFFFLSIRLTNSWHACRAETRGREAWEEKEEEERQRRERDSEKTGGWGS